MCVNYNLLFTLLLLTFSKSFNQKIKYQAQFLQEKPSKGDLWHPHLKIVGNNHIEDHMNKYYPVQLLMLNTQELSKRKSNLSPKENCQCKFVNVLPTSSLIQTKQSTVNKVIKVKRQPILNQIQTQQVLNTPKQKPVIPPNMENINQLMFQPHTLPVNGIPTNIPMQVLNYPYNTMPNQFAINYNNLVKRKILEQLLISDLVSNPLTSFSQNSQFFPFY